MFISRMDIFKNKYFKKINFKTFFSDLQNKNKI